jgi:Acylphosphatases
MVQKQIHIFVTGRVQGVFFRQSTKVMAIKNNVKGWVRNLDDDSVEIVAQGETQDIRVLHIGVKLDLQILEL